MCLVDSGSAWTIIHKSPQLKDQKTLQAIFHLQLLPEYLTLWAKGKYDAGPLQVPPVKIIVKPGAQIPHLPHYPLLVDQITGIQTQIQELLKAGVIR